MQAQKARLYFELQRSVDALKQAADHALIEAAGITTAQSAVIGLIIENGPLRQNQIAALLEQKEAAVTQMIAKLSARGLVARTRSEKDARAWQVALTEDGKRAAAKARQAFQEINRLLDTEFGDVALDFAGRLQGVRRALKARPEESETANDQAG